MLTLKRKNYSSGDYEIYFVDKKDTTQSYYKYFDTKGNLCCCGFVKNNRYYGIAKLSLSKIYPNFKTYNKNGEINGVWIQFNPIC